jgi:cytochrome c6
VSEHEPKQEQPLPSWASGLAMPVSLWLTILALGIGLIVGIDTGGGGTTSITTTTAGPAPSAAGAQVFASQGCGGCHTLKTANTSGTVGPNLDNTSLTQEQIAATVTNGRPGTPMPSFKDKLTPQQIDAVAAYVAGARSSG